MNSTSSAPDVEGRELDDVLGDPARIAALERSGLLDTPPEEEFDRLTRLACRLLQAPVAVMSLVAPARQFVKSESGLGEPWRTTREMPIGHSICRHIVHSGRPLVSSDARLDPLLRDSPAIEELGAIAYAGVPILDDDGQRLGALCVTSPEPRAWTEDEIELLSELAGLISSELRLRLELQATHGHSLALEEALALAHVGSWEWDPDRDALTLSSELRRLLGIRRRPPSRGPFEALLPADLRADFRARVRRALQPDGHWQAEHSIVIGAGSPRLMLSRGLARIAPGDTLQLLRGTLQDITEARDQEARFVAAFWGAPIGSALLGLVGGNRGHWLRANRELERILGAAPGALDGRPVELEVHPDDLDRTFLELDRLARGESARTQHEHRLRRCDGSWVWVLATHSAIQPAGGDPSYAMGHYVDIADRRRREQELEHDAHHDPLTGVFNRRRFEEELARTLSRAARSSLPGSLLVFDLDGFKSINDTGGHPAGDGVLVRVAHTIAPMLRAGDAFGRIGGDEFAILLPEADLAQSRRVAERVLRVVGRATAPSPAERRPGITASIGIAPWNGRAPAAPSQLLIEADTAMYEAKGSGGDQYAIYGPPADGTEGF